MQAHDCPTDGEGLPEGLLISMLQAGQPLILHSVDDPPPRLSSSTAFAAVPIVVMTIGVLWFLLCAIMPPDKMKWMDSASASEHRAGDNSATARSRSGALQHLTDPVILCMSLVNAINAAAALMFVPLLPTMERTLSASKFEVSLVMVCFGIAGAFGSPLLGFIADKHDRTYLLIQALMFSCIGLVATGLEKSLGWVIAARCLCGFCFAVPGICAAVIVRHTPASERAAALGIFAGACSVGATLAPGVAGVVSKGGHSNICYVVAGAVVLTMFCVWWVMDRPSSERRRGVTSSDEGTVAAEGDSASLRQMLVEHPVVLLWTLIYVVEFSVQPMVLQDNAFFAKDFFHATEPQLGILTMLGGAGIVFGALVVGFVVRRLGELWTFILACFIYGGSLVLMAVVRHFWFECAWVFFNGMGSAFMDPCIISIVSTLLPEKRMGTVLGMLLGLKGLGFVVGCLCGSILYARGSYWHFIVGGGVQVPFLLVAFLLAVFRRGQ